MGGCRCTYRNCTVKSDGKTHLFHYPVFDKVRCHQWLTNAGRYEFLNLKVSQLKNRCICQHHFADEWFMNPFKDKLKLQAIPTEDGPFCDSSKLYGRELPKETLGPYPLAYEDIENDEYISDRKANYNIKYADFLTNCEETMLLNEMCKVKDEDNKKFTEIEISGDPITINSNNKEVLQKLSINSNNTVDNYKDTTNNMFTHEIIIEPCPPTQTISNETASVKPTVQPVQKRRSKIRIISEKKITEPEKQIPVPISSTSFETVSPSMVLNVNKHKSKSQSDIVPTESTQNVINLPELISTINPRKFEIKVDLEEVEPEAPAKPLPVEKKIDKSTPQPVEPVVTPKKLSAERVAAINAKRQFNMKLRDIIEAGLNQCTQDPPKKDTIMKKYSQKKEALNETVAASLTKELSLPSKSDYIISFLESRMNRMENLLMSKIDQNTQKITELKKTLDPIEEPSEPSEKAVSLRSIKSIKLKGEAHKRQLYKEIQQYLTPDTNSMVYEELFINKFKPNANPELEPLKKRRCRW